MSGDTFSEDIEFKRGLLWVFKRQQKARGVAYQHHWD